MGTDYWIVLQWWGTLFLVGALAFPLTKKLFSSWYDQGYLFAKAVGMVVTSYLVYLSGMLHVFPFTYASVVGAMGVMFVGGVVLLNTEYRMPNTEKKLKRNWLNKAVVIIVEELFFLIALFFWSWIKAHEPSIHSLEKYMDFGFMKAILNSAYFPAPDMWYAGYPINYYYFGHTVVAVLTKLSGLDLAYTFNLMLSSIFAFTFTMSFSIGAQLWRMSQVGGASYRVLSIEYGGRKYAIHNTLYTILSGLLTAFLVTLAGNMQTIYAFTKGYTGEAVKPFWQLWWPLNEFLTRYPDGLERYWYANATRFIPFTIHEFPSYSFVVSDVHGHVMSLPFVLLAIALLIQIFGVKKEHDLRFTIYDLRYWFYGLLVSILLMTNALDGPIYLGLFLILFTVHNSVFIIQWREYWKQMILQVGGLLFVVVLTSIPFMSHFHSFVSGLAVNCPPARLAGQKFGPILFEAVEKCQHSPLWMMWLLWGFFVYCGGWLILRIFKFQFPIFNQTKKFSMNTKVTQNDVLLITFFFFSIALIIFPEYFYFKDIYPAHFRSNTMFKLGYDAFILFSIISGYAIVQAFTHSRLRVGGRRSVLARLFIVLLIPQLFLVSIYPLFSVRSYFDSLRTYKGLDGLMWLKEQYPDDYEGIVWLNGVVSRQKSVVRNQGSPSRSFGMIMTGLPVIIEADGDSYTDHARISAFTGLPSVIGWPVHEWLWRGSYDMVAPRREQVRVIYESDDMEKTQAIIKEYGITYIIIGGMEREKYPDMNMEKLSELGELVFSRGSMQIYHVYGAK